MNISLSNSKDLRHSIKIIYSEILAGKSFLEAQELAIRLGCSLVLILIAISPVRSQAPSGCVAIRLASNGKLLTNVNGVIKVQAQNNSDSQIWKFEPETQFSGFYRVVPKGGAGESVGLIQQTNGSGNSLGISGRYVGAGWQNWSLSLINDGNPGNKYGLLMRNSTSAMGSTIDWGNGSPDPGVADVNLVPASETSIYGSSKWFLDNKTCPVRSGSCDFEISLMSSLPNPVPVGSVYTHSVNCVGSGCNGVSYEWFANGAGTGFHGSSQLAYRDNPGGPNLFSVEATKNGCASRVSHMWITVVPSGGNSGGLCSPELIVGYGNASENYNYMVNTSTTGSYWFKISYSKWEGSSNATGSVKVNGGSSQSINLSNTGGPDTYQDVTFATNLSAGNNNIQINGGPNGYFKTKKVCATINSNSLPRLLIPDRIGLSSELSDSGKPNENLTLSPNPSSGEFDVKFFLESGKTAKLNVIDMQGKILHGRDIVGKGNHHEKIRMPGNSTGTFVVQILREDGQDIKKVVVYH